MVGILLEIGKQPENVGEEEVFGLFCIRDVTADPSGGLLRRPDIRPPEESSGLIFRDVTDGTGSCLSLHWLEMPKSAVCVPSSNGSKGDNANIRQFYSDEFNLKQPC